MTRSSSKESTARLFHRYVWLVDTIYRAGGITFGQINDRWVRSGLNSTGEELPLKTFHNHKTAVKTMFDIDIECDRSNGYAYYIDNPGDMQRGALRSWLLDTFAVNNLINESRSLQHRILFERIPSGQRLLAPVIEAMRDGVTLKITYCNYWHDQPYTFEVSPYCVKVFRQRWYLVAFSGYHREIRIYSLDRMQSAEATGHAFTLPPDFDGEAYFADCFGISHCGRAEFVEVKVFHGGRKERYFISLPLHPSQEIVARTDEYTVFRYYLRPTYDFRQELLAHGAEIEVLSPAWFREEIKGVVAEQLRRYRAGMH